MTTYYVDTAADPGGDGTTQATTGGSCAWDAVADVNAASFSAGDSILFKKGCTWLEQLKPPNSGDSNDQITFGAYGAGADPIISGMREVTGWGTAGNWTGGTKTWGENSGDDYTSVSEDCYMKDNAPDTAHNAQAVTISSDLDGLNRHGLYRFDVSDINDEATITSAYLKLTTYVERGAGLLHLHKILQTSWTEAGATWNKYDGSNTWNTAGAWGDGTDVDGTLESSTGAIGSITMAGEVVGILKTSTDLKTAVAAALAGDSFEFIITEESDQSIQFAFDSDTGTDGERPYMEITFTSNVWVMDLATNPRRLVIDGTEYIEAETASDVDSTYRWFYDSTNTVLHLYATENPATAYSTIYYAADGVLAIWIDAQSYITVQDIELQGAEWALYIKNASTNILVHDCTIGKWTWSQGIRIVGEVAGGKAQATDIEIYDCTIDADYHSSAIDWVNSVASDGIILLDNVASSKIYDCFIADWQHCCVQITCTVADCKTEYNEIYDNTMDGSNSNDLRGFDFTNDDTTGQTAYNKIYRNLISNMTVRNQLNGDHNEFYYNIIHTVTEGLTANYADGLMFMGTNGACHDNKAYNNVFYNIARNGIYIPDWGGEDIESNLIRNNIIMNWDMGTSTKYAIVMEADATVKGNTWQNNCLYKSGETDVVNYRGALRTIAEFNGENGNNSDVIQNNIGGDPKMIDPANDDFRLLMGSICRNAGVAVSLLTDYIERHIRHAPDIGAYEEQTNALF